MSLFSPVAACDSANLGVTLREMCVCLAETVANRLTLGEVTWLTSRRKKMLEISTQQRFFSPEDQGGVREDGREQRELRRAGPHRFVPASRHKYRSAQSLFVSLYIKFLALMPTFFEFRSRFSDCLSSICVPNHFWAFYRAPHKVWEDITALWHMYSKHFQSSSVIRKQPASF